MSREKVAVEKRRAFRQSDVDARYAEQGGLCALCPTALENIFIADHRVPRGMGGATDFANLSLICIPCNKAKTHGKGGDIAMVAKAKRIERKADPKTRPTSRRPLRSRGFDKRLSKGFDGKVRPR